MPNVVVQRIPRWRRTNAPAFLPGRVYLLLDLSGSGGVGVGGTAAVAVTVNAAGSGGLLLGGSATVVSNPKVSITGSGGISAGGTAGLVTNPKIGLVGSGGLYIGGAADVDVITSATGAGGVGVGGTATVAVYVAVAAQSGGVLAGGRGAIAVHIEMTGSGGLVLGGSADIDVIVDYEGIGGVSVGGHATIAVHVNATATGGLLAGGGAVLKLPELLVDHTGDLGIGFDGTSLITPTVGRLVQLPGERRFSFRYELLDSSNAWVADLANVTSCTVEQNWLADIKRKATFRLSVDEDNVIDYLSDRIRPWIRLHLPPYGDDDWVEWPQGVFLLSTPTRRTDSAGGVWREVEGYDQLQVYLDDVVTDRYVVASGTAYTTAVSTLLGSVTANITVSSSTLPTAKDWDPGTPKLRIINELLGAINYESLSFDEYGTAVVKPYVAPSSRAEEYTYADDDSSLILPEVEQTLDLFSVPNKWVLVVSDPDRAALVGTYTNMDPASPTSTVRRARTIVDFRTEQDAADQSALTAKAARLAFEASQVYEAIGFTTGLMPIHSGNDVYRIVFGPLAVNAKYSEHTWSMELKAGAQMRHEARRVVNV